VALTAGRFVPWLGLACAWTAILVGISRIFLVQHFLIDVLGGAAIGLLLALLLWRFDERFLTKLPILNAGLLRH